MTLPHRPGPAVMSVFKGCGGKKSTVICRSVLAPADGATRGVGPALGDGGSCCDARVGYRKIMNVVGLPLSCRGSRVPKPGSRIALTVARPPPRMPDGVHPPLSPPLGDEERSCRDAVNGPDKSGHDDKWWESASKAIGVA